MLSCSALMRVSRLVRKHYKIQQVFHLLYESIWILQILSSIVQTLVCASESASLRRALSTSNPFFLHQSKWITGAWRWFLINWYCSACPGQPSSHCSHTIFNIFNRKLSTRRSPLAGIKSDQDKRGFKKFHDGPYTGYVFHRTSECKNN